MDTFVDKIAKLITGDKAQSRDYRVDEGSTGAKASCCGFTMSSSARAVRSCANGPPYCH